LRDDGKYILEGTGAAFDSIAVLIDHYR